MVSSFDDRAYLEQIPISYHYVMSSQPCLIEPSIGWAIFGRTIVAESYPFWTNMESGWPPLPSLLDSINPFKKVTTVKKAVSFHYGWDNYYHFFTDTLPQVKYWLSRNNEDIIWIIPEKVKSISYVQDYLRLDPIFEGRNIIYQKPDEYIQVTQEAHFVKRSRVGSIELKSCVDSLLSLSNNIQQKKKNQKIFLIREEYRSAHNLAELIDIATSFGFRAINTEGMSLQDQIKLFSSTRWLIGFHGAGLTNMIFRKGEKMSLLELFPKNKIPLHYWHLTLDFGFNYSFCIGDSFIEKNELFYLEPNNFKLAIKNMMIEDHSLSL